MSNKKRASQFLPFNGLKGYGELLAEAEDRKEEEMALSEDRAQKLDTMLGQLEKGETLSVTFYENGHYRTWEGTLETIDLPFRFLRIEGKVIPFRHIWEIRKG